VSFLLDTCVLSELVKPAPAPSVVYWVRKQSEESFFLSVLTLGELHKGIAKFPSSRRRAELEKWIHQDLQSRFAGRILPITEDIASLWGALQGNAERHGHPLPVIDTLLAATALVHRLVLVTRDTSAAEEAKVPVMNPWEET
jgi:predicted nucleic acid-binding protein